MVVSILKEAQSTKVLRARTCHRLLPITHACYCGIDAIKEIAPKLLERQFPSGAYMEGMELALVEGGTDFRRAQGEGRSFPLTADQGTSPSIWMCSKGSILIPVKHVASHRPC